MLKAVAKRSADRNPDGKTDHFHDRRRMGRGSLGLERPLRRHPGRGRCADTGRTADQDFRDGARRVAGQSPGRRPGDALFPDHGAARSRAGLGLDGPAVRQGASRLVAYLKTGAGVGVTFG